MVADRIRVLLQEIRRKRGEDFDARDYLLHEPPATTHWAIQIEWIPGYGYTAVLSTKTAEATEFDIATEAAQRGVIAGDDIKFVKQVRRVSPEEAALWRNRDRRS